MNRLTLSAIAVSLFLVVIAATLAFAKPKNPALTPGLIRAIQANQPKQVEALLQRGADPNRPDAHGKLPLFEAVWKGHLPAIELLLAHGARVDARNREKQTLLMTVTPSPAVANLLLKRGAPVNAGGATGLTPLHSAALNLNDPLVDLYLRLGANPNVGDKRGFTPLHYTVDWRMYCVYYGQGELAEKIAAALIRAGADVNAASAEGITPLMKAGFHDYDKLVDLLLAAGARINAQDKKGRTPLTWAARSGKSSPTVKRLLKRGAKVALIDALLMEDRPLARRLLDEGAEPLQYAPVGETTLVLAAEQDDLALVTRLLKAGVPVNAQDDQGMTALMVAAGGRFTNGQMGKRWAKGAKRPGRLQVIRRLLADGADPTANNVEGDTAVSIAQEIVATTEFKVLKAHVTKRQALSDLR